MTDYNRLRELLKEAGMDAKWSGMFVKKLADDEIAFPMSDEQKKWALSRGFYPGRIELYGLNEDNYRNYLPDFGYFMIHPINHHFRIWVNDKLTLKYVLNSNGCADTMPRYFLYVENNGNYTYLMDAPEDIAQDKDFVFNLLVREGTLAAKPNSGTSGGRGFMKLEYRDGQIYENNKPIDRASFDAAVEQMRNYIVTEYAYQHEALSEIWPSSECTLRVIMFKQPPATPFTKSKWKCSVSYARFGTKISGGASNLSSGGIGIGFDFETGKYNDFAIRYRKFCADGQWKCYEHPDTHVVWKGAGLPNWTAVKEKILHVCDHIGSLDYLGFDVIITPDGLKFCEINTHPASDYEQVMCGPILKKDGAKEFFASKGMNNIKLDDFFKMYMLSQTEN